MKTIMWATLTANGNYAQSGPDNPPKPEALRDFAEHARAAGNFIVGRRTFESMRGNGGGGPFADLDIVVVSRSVSDMSGATVVGSPEEALHGLEQRGHRTALIGGGADLHNAYLSRGLIDELVFNVAPVLEGRGLNLLLDPERFRIKQAELLDCRPLGGGVVQLRYSIGR